TRKLFNGDIGLVLDNGAGKLQVFFQERDGLRAIPPSQLPPHETVYAMTIHKSQGSEFDRVILVLPDEESPVATRELLYTGITRARKQVLLCASQVSVNRAIARRVRRVSGLYRALWGDGRR
ncbi:MAG TPA: exodeoxyribonuclease V subunit alpha, partial [Chromatiaceae bacterium]|nr:exodeoxyribonuclease V subunit alpha [Chromatiaceae bacterium]